MAAGCGGEESSNDAASVSPVMLQPESAPPPRPSLLPVQSTDVAQPHQDLGTLEYDEPYTPEAIDDDHIDDKLRTMAVQRWGSQVDALVLEKISLSADRSTVSVSAAGAHLDGPVCSICRASAEQSSAAP